MARIRIGMFSFFSSDYTFLEFHGARQAARNLGCDLAVYFIGSPLEAGYHQLPSGWMLSYLPLHERNVDGLIFSYPTQELIEYAQELNARNFPVVLLAREAAGLNCVMADNTLGVKGAVSHLVEHGHREIAFLTGPDGNVAAAQRYEGYLQGLKEHGILFNPELFRKGGFKRDTSELAIMQLLENKVRFTAVITANDESAHGAVETLKRMGRRVPEDVAVIGFDNSPRARGMKPPLTTLAMPSYEMGYRSLELLLEQQKGLSRKSVHRIPVRLIQRISCGCQSEVVTLAGTTNNLERANVLTHLIRFLSSHAHQSLPQQIGVLAERLYQAACCLQDENFLKELRSVHEEAIGLGFHPEDNQNLISILRNHFIGTFPSGPEREKAEQAFHQARALFGELGVQHHVHQLNLKRTFDFLLRNLGRVVTSHSEEKVLLKTFQSLLKDHLKYFGIVFYDPSLEQQARLMGRMALLSNQNLDENPLKDIHFSLNDLDPFQVLPADRESKAVALYSLSAEEDEMGLLILEADSGYLPLYDNIVGHVSLALRNTRLFAILQKRTQELESLSEILRSQATELSRSNEETARFAYVAAHDLQEPLRMVQSYSQLLIRRYRDRLDSDAEEFVSYMVEGVTRMQALMQDLLAYLQVGTHEDKDEKVEMKCVLDKALRNLHQQIVETHAKIHFGDMPTLTGKPNQLVLLFQNLISNAVKYRGQQQPEVKITALQCETEWQFGVQDNGIGIDPQYFDKIFILFKRLHSREEYQGTGVGLALCKKIVEHHGGRIWVESSPGDGSTFHFTLPKCR